jgi:hypothetical protein
MNEDGKTMKMLARLPLTVQDINRDEDLYLRRYANN